MNRENGKNRGRAAVRAVLIIAFLGILIVAVGTFLAKREGPIPLDPVPPGILPAPAEAPALAPVAIAETGFGRTLIDGFAARPIPDWQSAGKGSSPQALLAKLAASRDIPEVNACLKQATPWSNVGSTWWAHKGDYDFTLTLLTTTLYLFGDRPDLLYPDTVDHLLSTLLVLDGGTPTIKVPRSLGLVRDTENHILMMESSRYLKNQWLCRHGSPAQQADPAYKNAANGLETWLLNHLDAITETGFYEFNSIPYLAYTMHPLLNLVSFAESDAIRAKAQYLIDQANWRYALGSLGFRTFPPFRRQPEHAKDSRLNTDPHSAFMYMWCLEGGELPPGIEQPDRLGQMLVATLTGYRLPHAVREWTVAKPFEYLAQIGRGVKGSPEIYSGGPGYLLSAGGVSRGARSHIVARPALLLLDDGAKDRDGCFHIQVPGTYLDWNNTGVYRRFACGPGPVHVPGMYEGKGVGQDWKVFRVPFGQPLLVAVYSTHSAGIIAVFPEWTGTPEELAASLEAGNPAPDNLETSFQWPGGGTITYDLQAPKGTWLIVSANGQPLDRDYDNWPMLSGVVPEISFAR